MPTAVSFMQHYHQGTVFLHTWKTFVLRSSLTVFSLHVMTRLVDL